MALIAVAAVMLTVAGMAQTTPPSGTLSPANPVINYTGGPFANSIPVATADTPPPCGVETICSQFALTIAIPATDFNSYRVSVKVSWTDNGTTPLGNESSDYDLYIYRPDITGSESARAATSSNPEITSFAATNGRYTIYVAPFDVSPSVPFNATVTLNRVGSTPWPTPEPTPPLPPGTPRFFNYATPPGMADDAGEPSIGVNWKTEKTFNGIPNGGTVNFFGGFLPYMLRATFNDSAQPAKVVWETADLTIADAPRVFGDPILFTDPVTGRTFVSQEMGLTPAGSTMEWTDNDGRTFFPSEGSGAPSGIDHQTVGGGPYAQPIPTGVNPLYPHGVWYCSQSVIDAVCSLSIDGGMTFGPAVPMYSLVDCGGLHGHIKIGPEGTAYVPNRACGGDPASLVHAGGKPAVIVSEDNGLSWDIRRLEQATTKPDRDPSVAVATDGTLYFAYQAADGRSRVAVSHDKGLSWEHDTDVGASLGIKNSLFHAAVAGDPQRAAVAFFGTTTGGDDYDAPDFQGVWYLYIATTFDGGQTWTTQNATPGDPIQRGGICGDGTCRNLLDFFGADIDKEGRVLVGYDDGCISQNCVSGQRSYGLPVTNDFTARAVIARQASGKRMFAAYDSQAGPDINPPPPPPPPPHPVSCDGNVASDASGDQMHPLLGSNGGNMDQVDITGVSFGLSPDNQSLVSTITLKNFSATPIAGTLGTFYYAVWTSARRNSDGTIASRTFATRAAVSITGGLTFTFGEFDPGADAFVGTTTAVTGSSTAGPNGTLKVNVPLSALGNPTIPVTDLNALPAVIEPYAVVIAHEQAVRFVAQVDRAPDAGSFGAHWAVCLPPVVTCLEDDDSSIAYSDGWHTVNKTGASGGHFRLHTGKSASHSASLSIEVAAGRTGKLTYNYAASSKGGSAQIFLDGVSQGTINYKGASGSLKDPVFGAKVEFSNLSPGSHLLEIKNMTDAVYVDGFCLESSSSTGQPASGPGPTSTNSSTLSLGQELSTAIPIGSEATAISLVAESNNNLSIKLVLIKPSGSLLQTAESSNGVAVINSPVSESGLYVVKVINLNLGSVQVWTAATPTVRR